MLKGLVWSGLVWSGLVWSGLVWSGLVWSGLDWTGLVWSGLVWSGLVWSGLVWSGLTIVWLNRARTCLTIMLCFLEDVTKWVDEGSPVDIIYLDLKKAFDKVPHQRLPLKLKAHGIGNGMINWIAKWLIVRRQRVVVDGEVSNWKSVLSTAGISIGTYFVLNIYQ